jgi:hypothetical protein
MKKFLPALALCSLMLSCLSHSKKVIIYASSDIQVDNSQKNITVTDGTTHHEKELEFSGADAVQINVQSPTGKYTLEAKDDGLFIANLKPDTVVGSQQHVGQESEGKITQEQLKQRTDSLTLLVAGRNITEAGRNFFIPPHQIVKISTDTRSKVFGPFTSIPSAFDAGSAPSVFKFYTNNEVREIIAKLSGFLKYEEK